MTFDIFVLVGSIVGFLMAVVALVRSINTTEQRRMLYNAGFIDGCDEAMKILKQMLEIKETGLYGVEAFIKYLDDNGIIEEPKRTNWIKRFTEGSITA